MLKVMQDLMKKQKEKIPESSRNQLSSVVYNKEKQNRMCWCRQTTWSPKMCYSAPTKAP